MPAMPPLFVGGAADPASADVPIWAGIAFTSTPGEYLGESAFTQIVKTDGANALQTFSSGRGRQHELNTMEAATCQAQFHNGDGALDPANVDSSYYPNVRPLRRLRILRHENGVTHYVFDGLIERYEPDWVTPRNDAAGRVGHQNLGVQAVDQFGAFAVEPLLDPVYSTMTTALSGSNNDLTFTSRYPGGSDISVEYTIIPDSEPDGTSAAPGEVVVTGSKITYRQGHTGSPSFLRSASLATVKASLEADPASNQLVVITYPAGNDGSGFINSNGGAGETSMAETFLTGSGWPQEQTGARIARALDTIAWPSGGRVLDSGLYEIVADEFSLADNTSVLAHLIATADAELGYVFVNGRGQVVFHDGDHRIVDDRSTESQATFSDDGTGWPYHDIEISFDLDRIYNDVTITGAAEGAIAQRVEDAASIAEFGRRAYSKSVLLADDADCLTLAEAILDAYAQPIIRFDAITILDVGTSGWADVVLAREIGDRITVRTSPPAHSTVVTYDCFIEAIEHTGGPGVPWQTRFQLSNVSASSSGGGGDPGGGGAVFDAGGDPFILDSGTEGVLG